MDNMVNQTIVWLLPTTMQASLIVLLIITVRLLFNSQLKPGWSYALWLILICRLILPGPVSIQLPAYLHSIHPLKLSQHYQTDLQPLSKTPTSSFNQQTQNRLQAADNVHTPGNHWTYSLFFIWLFGVTVFSGRYLRKIYLTRKHVYACKSVKSEFVLNVHEAVKGKLSIKRTIDLKHSTQISSPASYGILKPGILLPDSAICLDEDKLELVLEHELRHHKRADIVIDAVMAIVKSIHWFNPLIWLAHREMQNDCELACDFQVTRNRRFYEKQVYGELLIKFATSKPVHKNTYAITLMSAKLTQLSQRIVKLTEQPGKSIFKSIQTASVSITICLCGLTSPATLLATQHIIFDYSTSQGISDFSNQRMDKEVYLENQSRKMISGILTQPGKTGKTPAIILIHGCEGFDARHENWANYLNDIGYITLRIQRQGVSTPYCDNPIAQINTFTASQVMDSFAALDYLNTLEFVDGNNINIMSWESWAAIGAAATYGVGQVYQNRFNAAIAMYPDCTATYNGEFDSPLLIMVGDSDHWAQPGDCLSIQTIAEKSNKQQIDVKVYTDTYHGFDNREISQATYLPYAKNLGHLSVKGAVAKYNHLAYLDAQKQIGSFLNNHHFTE